MVERRSQGFWVCAVLSVLCWGVGCGSTVESVRGSSGLEVHTLREEYTNVHAVRMGESVVLIDAGLERSQGVFVQRLRELGVDGERVQVGAIVVTHGHADHIGSAGHFRKVFGAKVLLGEGDRQMAKAGRIEGLCPTGWIAHNRLEEDGAERFSPVEADVLLREGKARRLEEFSGVPGEVVVLPGHTEGSVVVVIGEWAFVGDLFRGGIVGGGVETHFYMCDLEDNRRDIRWLLDTYPHVHTYFPGHFGPVSRQDVEDYLEEFE